MRVDRSQPTSERAAALAAEPRQLADEHGHDFLNEIIYVIAQVGLAQQPATDQRAVKAVQPLPGGIVRLAAQALQQAGGRVHGDPLCLDRMPGNTALVLVVTRTDAHYLGGHASPEVP